MTISVTFSMIPDEETPHIFDEQEMAEWTFGDAKAIFDKGTGFLGSVQIESPFCNAELGVDDIGRLMENLLNAVEELADDGIVRFPFLATPSFNGGQVSGDGVSFIPSEGKIYVYAGSDYATATIENSDPCPKNELLEALTACGERFAKFIFVLHEDNPGYLKMVYNLKVAAEKARNSLA